MDIRINESIKRLRKAREITQEELAGYLGVSFQSVSKWERGDGFPDISMLPGLANFFDISVDELIGMDEIRNQTHLNDIFALAHEYEAANHYMDATAVLRDAIKSHPNNYGLMSELAISLSFEDKNTKKGMESAREAIVLSEKVLANCTGEKVRSTTRANLCFLYKSIGEQQKAIDLARTLPHIWESREMILPELFEGQEYTASLEKSVFTILTMICEKMDALESPKGEKVKVEKMIALGPHEMENRIEGQSEIINKINKYISR